MGDPAGELWTVCWEIPEWSCLRKEPVSRSCSAHIGLLDPWARGYGILYPGCSLLISSVHGYILSLTDFKGTYFISQCGCHDNQYKHPVFSVHEMIAQRHFNRCISLNFVKRHETLLNFKAKKIFITVTMLNKKIEFRNNYKWYLKMISIYFLRFFALRYFFHCN